MNDNVEKTSDDRAEDTGGNVAKDWGNHAEIWHLLNLWITFFASPKASGVSKMHDVQRSWQ